MPYRRASDVRQCVPIHLVKESRLRAIERRLQQALIATPEKIPGGSKLIAHYWYDNSKQNPANPDLLGRSGQADFAGIASGEAPLAGMSWVIAGTQGTVRLWIEA